MFHRKKAYADAVNILKGGGETAAIATTAQEIWDGELHPMMNTPVSDMEPGQPASELLFALFQHPHRSFQALVTTSKPPGNKTFIHVKHLRLHNSPPASGSSSASGITTDASLLTGVAATATAVLQQSPPPSLAAASPSQPGMLPPCSSDEEPKESAQKKLRL